MNEKVIKFFTNEKTLLFLLSVVFLFFLLPNIRFPGLNSGEAMDGVLASHILRDVPVKVERSSIILFLRSLPIMARSSYVGAVESYLLLPFFLLFGINVFSLRLMPISISLITMFFIYYLCRAWFGRKMALVTILLTVTNVVFVMYTRVGLYREELFSIFFFWAGLFFCWKYLQGKKVFYFYLGIFLFALGLFAKIVFLWFIFGIVIAYAILRKKFLFTTLKLRQLILGLLVFFLGIFPLLFDNFVSGGETIKLMLSSLLQSSVAGVNNLAYLENLLIRIGQLFCLLKGDIHEVWLWCGSKEAIFSKDSLTPIIFGLGFVFVFFFSVFKNGEKYLFPKDKILFFYILYLTAFLCSPFTVSSLDPGHLFILFPFPQMVMALFLCTLLQLFTKKKVILFFIYFTFLISILFNVRMIIDYHLAMRRDGGRRDWTTAVYELAGYLHKNKILTPLVVNGGFTENVLFLTNSAVKLNIKELCGHSVEEVLIECKEQLLKGDAFYLLIDEFDEEAKVELLKNEIIKSLDRSLTLNKVFLNRAGIPVYSLYEVH